MSNLPELIGLFARLASQIEIENSETSNSDQPDDVLVAALNQSLNLRESSRVRVLDTALSLMCFTAPQVLDSVTDYSVNTIVSVLSSSVDCKVLRFGNAEVLRIGGSISAHDSVGVMESCADVLGKLKEHGMLSCSLLYAAVRVAAMATQFRYTMQVTPALFVQSTDRRRCAISKLVHYIPKRISLENQELQLRLLLWYLDPQILVEDVSQVLQDAVQRPFICLSEELYEKMEWRSIIICLALSPLMFIETRALLHSWFLLTGLASVLELQVELVSMVLDLLSRPMWWGLSAGVGSKLPFSHAYFLFKHRLFRTLAGPLSCGGFLELILKIKKSISRSCQATLEHVATTTPMVDHKSTWAMAMNFPDWFYFASLLLLSENNFSDSYMSRTDEDNQLQASSFSAAAAWYIAWILDPVGESLHSLLAEKLEKLSRILIGKHLSSYEHEKTRGACEIKLKKAKPNDKTKDASQQYTCQTIELWLEEFQDVYICYYGKSTGSPKPYEAQKIDIPNNVMFRRITLGILLGCSGSINEDGCELLLHYAATGTILQSTETQHVRLKHRRWNCDRQENRITCIDKCSRKEAVAGACVVFLLTDIAENMSDSVSGTREIAVGFICQIKLKVVKYLLKCVKRLLQFEIDQNNGVWVKDLHRRILRWRHQGKDIFHGHKDLDDAINVIANCSVTGRVPSDMPLQFHCT
ncbi:hypothetical protein Ccrd_003978 [Cynara cardunculus var. scolymus]|uniref:Uncharacterized protein n=1 Tax=Cynara cardunculus var. scolymus TaxID=59895 RepID=A0A103XNF0_CYNCS|nr:hypothetical protein Ccrd_003978 [Cynara cardunculus var. scolymus]